MRHAKNHGAIVLLGAVLFLIVLSGPAESRFTASAQATSQSSPSATGSIVLDTTIDPLYDIFNLNEYSPVIATIDYSNLNLNASVTLQLISNFSPTNITAVATSTNGTATQIQVTVARGLFAVFTGYYVVLPQSTDNVSIVMEGNQGGSSFLFRFVSNIPFVSATGLSVTTSYTVQAIIPRTAVISEAFGPGSSSVAGSPEPIPTGTTAGAPPGFEIYFLPKGYATIVMQSILYVPVAIVVTVLAALLLLFTSLSQFKRGRDLLNKISNGVFRRVKYFISTLFQRLGINQRGKSRSTSFRNRFPPKTLLILFIMCAFLMVSIAALTGPGPTARVYVVASSTERGAIQHDLQQAIGNVELVNPSQDYSDIDVMSSIGEFKVIVISSYQSASLPDITKNILPELGNIPIIIIDNSADPTFAAQINALYPDHVVNVTNAAALTPAETQQIGALYRQDSTPNLLGFHLTDSSYTRILELEAALSFLLVFLGWVYLGAKIAEPGVETSLARVGSVIMSGIFVFVFSEVVYVITSATLAFPISLHAVISGAQSITATGLMGRVVHLPLGGGSTPRLAVGVLGLLFGALVLGGERVFSKTSLAFIVGLFIILLVNPFTIGKVMFQGLLLFVGNTPLGTAYASSLSLKGFLYGIGSALGGGASPVYLMSAGKMVYFAGLVPLAFLRKMGKNTATLTLLIAAVLVGDGGVRVGEMTPEKTVVAILPGLVAGMAFSLVLLLISAVEKYLTPASAESRS